MIVVFLEGGGIWAVMIDTCIFFHWLYSPRGPWTIFSVLWSFFTDDRTPWTSDQLIARPLPKHRTTQTQNKHIHTPNIHALSGIRTHDPSVERAKTVHALAHSATGTGKYMYTLLQCITYQMKKFQYSPPWEANIVWKIYLKEDNVSSSMFVQITLNKMCFPQEILAYFLLHHPK
jgi:hypothetical protein